MSTWTDILAKVGKQILKPATRGRSRSKLPWDDDTPANRRRKHVLPDGDDWIVRSQGAERASSTHRTQSAAIDEARRAVKRAGGGEVVIHGADGRIRDTETVEAAAPRKTAKARTRRR